MVKTIMVRVNTHLLDEAVKSLGAKSRVEAVEIALREVIAKKGSDHLGPGFVKALIRAEEVFNDHEKAMRWMKSPILALGGQVPADIVESPEGMEFIMDTLGRIEHGIHL